MPKVKRFIKRREPFPLRRLIPSLPKKPGYPTRPIPTGPTPTPTMKTLVKYQGPEISQYQKEWMLKPRKPLTPEERQRLEELQESVPKVKSFRKGGQIKKTGTYKLHKGEEVVTRKKPRLTATKKKRRARQAKAKLLPKGIATAGKRGFRGTAAKRMSKQAYKAYMRAKRA